MKDDPQQLMELFNAALERPAGVEREAYLAAVCRGDTARLARLGRLLDAHEQAGDFLKEPAYRPPPDQDDGTPGGYPGDLRPDPGDDTAGATIGSYRLLEEIGEGSFGRVFRAEQTEPVHRCVALKVIKAGMDTREVVARFEAERQALALMDHPHIAKVFEAGATEAGRPYFVMELVDGLPITKFCDQHRLATADRLALFIKVCHAVQHAHQKGVIHRDLKPSNILVAQIDGEPEPKIIDFGVAKALGPKLTECTLLTVARQIIGTPGYMSPEQADPQDGDIDTRCDIYSLGVLLYELLTGVTPFDTVQLHRAAVDEIRRIIRETDPPKPSTRLRELGVQLGVVARHRRTEPAALTRSVHGDLDWIVMKALEKDRARRYQSISALAEDIHHHLAHEPVSAGPPGRLYRLGKFTRRHRFGTAMAAAAVVAALASLATLAIGLHQAKQERDRAVAAEARAEAEAKRAASEAAKAEVEAKVAEQANSFLCSDLLGQGSPLEQPDRDVKLRTLVDRAADKVGGRFKDKPRLELETRFTLAAVFRNLGELKMARAQLDRANLLLRKLNLPADSPTAIKGRFWEVIQLHSEGKPAQARIVQNEILAVLRRMEGPEHRETLITISRLTKAYLNVGTADERVKLLDEILLVSRRVWGPEHPTTLTMTAWLATNYRNSGRPEQAVKLLEQWLPVRRRVSGSEHPDTLGEIEVLADCYSDLGRTDEAAALLEERLAVHRRVLGPEHPNTLASISDLSYFYMKWGRAEDAVKLLENALPVSRRVLGPINSLTPVIADTLAVAYFKLGRVEEAIRLLEENLPDQRRVLGPGHPNTLATMLNLAEAYIAAGKAEKVVKLLEEILSVIRRVPGAAPPDTLKTIHNLATRAFNLARTDEAAKLLKEILPMLRQALGPEHPCTLAAGHILACAYWDLGKAEEAIDLFEELLPLLRRVLGPVHPDTLQVGRNLASAYQGQGEAEKSVELLEELLPLHRRVSGSEHPDTLAMISYLASAYGVLGRGKEAVTLSEELLPVRRRVSGPEHPDTLDATQILAEAYIASERAGEATKLLEDLLPVHRRVSGPEHPATLATAMVLATARFHLGKVDEATRLLKEILPVLRRVLGPGHVLTSRTLQDLVTFLCAAGKPREAETYLDAALAADGKLPAPVHAMTIAALAVAFHEQGDTVRSRSCCAKLVALDPAEPSAVYWCALAGLGADAPQLYRASVDKIARSPHHGKTSTLRCLTQWVCVLRPEAVADYKPLVEAARRAVAEQDSAVTRRLLGALLYRTREHREAVQQLANSFEAGAGDRLTHAAYSGYFLAMAHVQLGNSREAREWFRKASALDPLITPPAAAVAPPLPWNRKLTLQLLRREAAQVLDKAGAPVSGNRQPTHHPRMRE